jgi:hypothetical protein
MHQLDPALPPPLVFARLDAAVQRLVVATQLLYGGKWDDCAEDVRRRQAGRPYLYRLRINLDDLLGWLHRLKTYEEVRGEGFASVITDETGEEVR